MPLTRREIRARARKIKLLLMDVDGVLSNGRIYYLPQRGGAFIETKSFSPRDGLGIRLAQKSGIKTGIISGRGSPIVLHRAQELGIEYVEQNNLEKLEPYLKIRKAAGLTDEEVCYIGDDIVDLPVLIRVGLAVAVGNGHELLRRYVHYVTKNPGGGGAVRETIELILSAQGKFREVLKYYLRREATDTHLFRNESSS